MLEYLQRDVDITNFSGYRTKAMVKYFFELKNLEDLEKLPEIMDFVKDEDLKILFLGGGMNCLFAFDIFDGVIIKNNMRGFDVKDGVLEVYSGESVIYLASKLEKDFGIQKLKPWSSLPGTVGGAVVGNAGCFGLEVKDILIGGKIYDLQERKILDVGTDFFGFEYRDSILKKDKRYFVISAKFDISKNVDNFYSEDFRFKNQPKGFNCGSVFKNPIGDSAGRILDKELHLNGTKYGGAMISEVHSNIILNTENATYKDILYLIDLAKKMALEKFSIKLEEEINIISN